MGYFANAIVLTSEPDFNLASAANPDRLARGYKHKIHPIWLLDYWKPRGKLGLRQAPFCDPAIGAFRTDISTLNAQSSAFLGTLQRLKQHLNSSSGEPEISYVHLAIAVAAKLQAPVFCFAADDEELDFGCRVEPGSVVSLGCRFDWLEVRYSNGQVAVTPQNVFTEGNEDEFEGMIVGVESLAGVSVLPAVELENGRTLYENPVEQWPVEAGYPAEVLGLGTWDPLLNVESDFTVVYEKLSV